MTIKRNKKGEIKLYTIFGVKWRFSIGRDKADPEKAVTPMIMYINTNHSAFTDVKRKCFMLIFGWWDFSIKFGRIV